jgi:hypothetical protein
LQLKLTWKWNKNEHLAIPPYVPAKSKALKNISGSNNESISGGTKVSMYGRGLFWPVGRFNTEKKKTMKQ